MNRKMRLGLLTMALAATIVWAYRDKSGPKPIIDPKCNVNAHTGHPTNEFRDMYEPYPCMNNVNACTEGPKEALTKVDRKRWGPFDFFCYEGKVANVYSLIGSPISKDHMAFIKENPELFGLKTGFSVSLSSGDRGEQVYRGLRVAAGVWLGEHKDGGRYGDENWSELLVMVNDSSSWTFDPAPKIDQADALKLAKAYWEPVRPPQIADWRTEATYGIRAVLPKNSDCPVEPAGAWFIRGFGYWNPPGGGNTNTRNMNAIIDGKSGLACSYYGRNGSDRR